MWTPKHRETYRRCGGRYPSDLKVKGRKMHALVDTEGLSLRVIVHSAGTQDRDGAALALTGYMARFPRLEPVWAVGVYKAGQVDAAVAKISKLRIEIVKRSDVKGLSCYRPMGRRENLLLVRT